LGLAQLRELEVLLPRRHEMAARRVVRQLAEAVGSSSLVVRLRMVQSLAGQ
jgi:hypothetical protein